MLSKFNKKKKKKKKKKCNVPYLDFININRSVLLILYLSNFFISHNISPSVFLLTL